MKVIKLKTNDVAPTLERVASIVNQKNTIEALKNIRIDVLRGDDGSLNLSFLSSNSEVWLRMQVPCLESTLDSPIYVDAKSLSQSFKSLSDLEIEIAIDEEKHILTCNYGKGEFKLPFSYDMVFPMPPMPQGENIKWYEHTMDAVQLYSALTSVSYSAATDVIRKSLNGVHCDFMTDGMVSVATDGFTLAKYKDFTLLSTEPHDITISREVCALLSRILNSTDKGIKLKFNENYIIVSGDDFEVYARPIDLRYVQYEHLIPASSTYICNVDKAELMTALNHVIPFGTNDTACVELRFGDHTLRISAENYDYQKSASEDVASEHDFQADDFFIGFNGWKFAQILKEMNCERVRIGFTDAEHAALFQPAEESECYENIAILMPIRID